MRSLPVPPIPVEIVEQIRLSIEAGKDREEVFAEMRDLGLFMTDSIRLTHKLYGLSHGDAKLAVHYSETWADCREANDALHDSVVAAAKELGFEEAGAEQPVREERAALQEAR